MWLVGVRSSLAVCLCALRCEFLVYAAVPNGDHALVVVRKVEIKLSNRITRIFVTLAGSKIGHRPAGM